MSTYRYAVKVRRSRLFALWTFECESCHRQWPYMGRLQRAHLYATSHAAQCDALHWANWESACDAGKVSA